MEKSCNVHMITGNETTSVLPAVYITGSDKHHCQKTSKLPSTHSTVSYTAREARSPPPPLFPSYPHFLVPNRSYSQNKGSGRGRDEKIDSDIFGCSIHIACLEGDTGKIHWQHQQSTTDLGSNIIMWHFWKRTKGKELKVTSKLFCQTLDLIKFSFSKDKNYKQKAIQLYICLDH